MVTNKIEIRTSVMDKAKYIKLLALLAINKKYNIVNWLLIFYFILLLMIE